MSYRDFVERQKGILYKRIMTSQAFRQVDTEELHELQLATLFTDCECNKNLQEISLQTYTNLATYLATVNIMSVFKLSTSESSDDHYEVCIGVQDFLPQDGVLWKQTDITCHHDFWNLQFIYCDKITGTITTVFKMSLDEMLGARSTYTRFSREDVKTAFEIMDGDIIVQPMIPDTVSGKWVIIKKGFEDKPFIFNSLADLDQIFREITIPADIDFSYEHKLKTAIKSFKESVLYSC